MHNNIDHALIWHQLSPLYVIFSFNSECRAFLNSISQDITSRQVCYLKVFYYPARYCPFSLFEYLVCVCVKIFISMQIKISDDYFYSHCQVHLQKDKERKRMVKTALKNTKGHIVNIKCVRK